MTFLIRGRSFLNISNNWDSSRGPQKYFADRMLCRPDVAPVYHREICYLQQTKKHNIIWRNADTSRLGTCLSSFFSVFPGSCNYRQDPRVFLTEENKHDMAFCSYFYKLSLLPKNPFFFPLPRLMPEAHKQLNTASLDITQGMRKKLRHWRNFDMFPSMSTYCYSSQHHNLQRKTLEDVLHTINHACFWIFGTRKTEVLNSLIINITATASAMARVSEAPPEISRGAPHALLAYFYELQKKVVTSLAVIFSSTMWFFRIFENKKKTSFILLCFKLTTAQ